LLEAARATKLPRFVHISTDEVYGSAPTGASFTEETILIPQSLRRQQASADHFVTAYANTYGVSRLFSVVLTIMVRSSFPRS